MKTFKQFMCENEGEELSKLRRTIKELTQRGLPIPPALLTRATELAKNDRIGAKMTRQLLDKPEKKENPNSYITGKPSKEKDTRGSGGSLPNIATSADIDPNSKVRVRGRYGDTSGGRGTGISRTGENYGVSSK